MDNIQDLGKCPLIERSQSKALLTTLTFSFLQQKAQATSRLLNRR